MIPANSYHRPVLADEAVDHLVTRRDGIYVDATVGGGGHSSRILSRLAPAGRLVAIDRDAEALQEARVRLSGGPIRVDIIRGDFGRLGELAQAAGIVSVSGVLIDPGVSSHQLDTAERGFSYRDEGPLDLRMDREGEVTAEFVVNTYAVDRLTRILFEFGEERQAARMARAIAAVRVKRPLATTADLARVIATVANPRYLNRTLSRVFQAIRIEVNDELNQLRRGLEAAVALLEPGGRLVVIAYHSLEDRIVKQMFRDLSGRPVPNVAAPLRLITKKPITPSAREVDDNPRARSAKMRVAEKV
jgi:16S rRNA (cytosine1402-N4)-methyltransferase